MRLRQPSEVGRDYSESRPFQYLGLTLETSGFALIILNKGLCWTPWAVAGRTVG